jgi:glycogen synthase
MASTDGDAEPGKRDIKNHLLFEIATEVANRGSLHTPCHLWAEKLTYAVGGIYSVLKSKAPVTTAEYGERYCLIGPLNRASVSHPTPEPGVRAPTDIALGCCRSRAPRSHL